MIPPFNCPYNGLTAPPCYGCAHHIADTGECGLENIASAAGRRSNATTASQTYEERMRDYERRRQELLQLSKETLVDLIIHRPTFY